MNDAPAAPEGWYTHPDSPGEERWWDGKVWTGATRSAVQTPASPSSAATPGPARKPRWGLMWVLIAAAVILTIIGVNLLNLSGQISQADSGDRGAPVTSGEDRELPPGFEEIAPGIGMMETDRICGAWEKCVTANVYAVDGCPTHLAIEITPIGKERGISGTTGVVSDLEPATRAAITFGYRSNIDHIGYKVTSVKCR